MVEDSRPWGGTVTGDAGPYSEDQWMAAWRSIGRGAAIPTNLGGVLRNELNELVVTGATSPLSVDTGRALAHGTWYENTAAVSVAVATPGGATRIDRIVLRKDWTLQTVRIFRIAGAEGGGAPALVQTDGVTWDTPLYQASITTGGAITLTDEREFISRPGLVLEGANLTEATTTSLVGVDLLAVTGLSLPVDVPLLVMVSVRKAAGAAARVEIGLKLNATQSFPNTLTFAADNSADGHLQQWWMNDRQANYLQAHQNILDFTTGSPRQLNYEEPMPSMLAAVLTSITVTGLTQDALVTVGVRDLRVFSLG